MGDTSIEWTRGPDGTKGKTWNPVVGCEQISLGCGHCYAKTIHDMRHAAYLAGKKLHPQYAVPFEHVQLMPDRLEDPLRWRKPKRVFVNSVSDLFHEDVPFEFLDRVFAVMALARAHTFQVLTKRPERMFDYFDKHVTRHMWAAAATEFSGKKDGQLGTCDSAVCNTKWPLPNVWLGVSVENQKAADERIPLLQQTPAAVRFLSCEPLLGAVDLAALTFGSEWHNGVERPWQISCLEASAPVVPDGHLELAAIDWVICGGESGDRARPMHPDWARSLRDQCAAAGVPFFFKQWGEYRPESRRLTANGKRYDPRVVFVRVNGTVSNPKGAERNATLLQPFDPIDRGHPGWCIMKRVGKSWAGRELDGRVWDEFPREVVHA